MKRTMLSRGLTIIGLSLWLFGWSGIEKGQIVEGSSWGRQGIVQLPKVENPHESAIDSDSLIVTVPTEGEFYVAGRRLSSEILAATIRDELKDKPAQEQLIYIRSRASLRFNAVRQVLNIMREVGYDRLAFVVETGASRREAALETQIFMPDGVKVDPSDHIKVPPPRPETSPRPAPPPPPPPPPPAAAFYSNAADKGGSPAAAGARRACGRNKGRRRAE
jgi:biopolymer transport protein ExbD